MSSSTRCNVAVLCGPQKEETESKELVVQWQRVKEEVKALEELEQEARKEVRRRASNPVGHSTLNPGGVTECPGRVEGFGGVGAGGVQGDAPPCPKSCRGINSCRKP